MRSALALALLAGACGSPPALDASTGDDAGGLDAGPRDGAALDAATDPCAALADGDHCADGVLVSCAAGRTVATLRCPDGCADATRCAEPVTPDFCVGKLDGAWCDGDALVVCDEDAEASRTPCPEGCVSRPIGENDRCATGPATDFCSGKLDGDWCDGDDLVTCASDAEALRVRCAGGCLVRPVGTPDECADAPVDFCAAVPPVASSDPPASMCNYMDWGLEPDGWYLISRFGTTNDATTLGRTTTCGWLQDHYDYRDCVYDAQTASCLPGPHAIPWAQGHVDYDYATVIAGVDAMAGGDVTPPDWFYVAGAQRFHCGTTLRVSNPVNGRCVVAYAEDGGPGARYEYADRGGRRILDSSPAVVRYLGVERWGWASADLVYVEWGLPGDVPGHACAPCASTPARAGSIASASGFDPNHMLPIDCR